MECARFPLSNTWNKTKLLRKLGLKGKKILMLLVGKAPPNVIGDACLSLRTGSQRMTTEKIVYPLSAL